MNHQQLHKLMQQQKSMKMGKSHQQSDDDEEEEESSDEETQEEEENDEEFEQEFPEAKAETKSVLITMKKLQSGDSSDKKFSWKMGVNEEFKWLMIYFCVTFGKGAMDEYTAKFTFNGTRVRETDTPLRLSMVDNDVIYVFPPPTTQGVQFHAPDLYRTLCIRMRNRRDTFVRVTCTDPLVQQLRRHVSLDETGKSVSTRFVYRQIRLTENHCVAVLRMDDGDIVEAFDVEENNCLYTKLDQNRASDYRAAKETINGQCSGKDTVPERQEDPYLQSNSLRSSRPRIHLAPPREPESYIGPQPLMHRRTICSQPLREPSLLINDIDVDDEDNMDEDMDDDLEGLSESELGRAFNVKRTRISQSAAHLKASSSTRSNQKRKAKMDQSWVIKEYCPGGPTVPDVIPNFGGHIAHALWDGVVDGCRGVLTGYHKATNFGQLIRYRLHVDAASSVKGSGLAHLGSIGMCMKHLNMPLLSAFIERWQPDTNTFHLPFGEMSILLHDVAFILGIPIDGLACGVTDQCPDTYIYICEFFGKGPDELKLPFKEGVSTPIYKGGAVSVDAVMHVLGTCSVEEQAQGYLFLLLGMTLFVDKSSDRVNGMVFPLIRELSKVSKYAWGAGVLAYLYRELGIATRVGSRGIAGCLTLLQVWIYEYFPMFRPCTPATSFQPRARAWVTSPPFDGCETKLSEYRRQLDKLTSSDIRWSPFASQPDQVHPRTLFSGLIRYMDIVEPYQPDRCMRQFGYVQVIPTPMPRHEICHRSGIGKGFRVDYGVYADHPWEAWPNHRIVLPSLSRLVSSSDDVDPSYMSWYKSVSHPLIIDPHSKEGQIAAHASSDHREVYKSLMMRFYRSYQIPTGLERQLYFERLMNDYEPFVTRWAAENLSPEELHQPPKFSCNGHGKK